MVWWPYKLENIDEAGEEYYETRKQNCSRMDLTWTELVGLWKQRRKNLSETEEETGSNTGAESEDRTRLRAGVLLLAPYVMSNLSSKCI